jgi:hypothetical protein
VLMVSMNCGFYSLEIKMRVLADYAGGEVLRMEKQGENRRVRKKRTKTKTEMARLRKKPRRQELFKAPSQCNKIK